MKIITLLLISIVFSCQESPKNVDEIPKEKPVSIENTYNSSQNPKNSTYFEFKLDTLSNFKLADYEISDAYQIGANKIVTGYDRKANPDRDKNWGDKLLLLNNKNEIVFKSNGFGDVYLFQPHFYKNNTNEKIIIVCQLAYEYYFGGETFLYENGAIEYVGNIDVEGKYEETNLIDILEINEKNDKLIFTFNSDSIIYKPDNEDIMLKNNAIRYEYKNKEMKLIK